MKDLPVTVRRSIELLGLLGIGYIFAKASEVITPFLMAFFLAIMLLPIYRFLKRIRFPEVLAIALSLLTALVLLVFVGWFFWMQIARLLADIPTIQENLNAHFRSISGWINEKTNFTTQQQLEWLRAQSNSMLGNATNYLSGAALTVTGVFVFIGLLPIYAFLILYYKNLLIKFVFTWFSPGKYDTVNKTLLQVETIIKSYLVGLLIQITYITVLLGGLLMILGIKHALLIGLVFAFLNLIPYVGALIGNIIGVLLTITSSQDLTPVITVLASIAVVQFLDNNILMPRIVGSKVRLNALASIIGVIIGGALAGVAGMFLSLPVMAILKITFDHSDSFKHWGLILGDEQPKANPMTRLWIGRRKRTSPPRQTDKE